MTTHAMTAAPLVTRILHLPITTDAEAFVTVARATERVVVQLGNPGFEHRDRLGRFVVRGIETELGRVGAAPPGWRYDDGLEAILNDQIYRARLLGCAGLALGLPSLRDLADSSGQLGTEDSNTLRRLVDLAEREPLQLYFPQPCADLRVVGSTESLSAWLPRRMEAVRLASIEYDDPAGASQTSIEPLGSTHAPELGAPPLEAFIDGQSLAHGEAHAAAAGFTELTPLPPMALADELTPLPPMALADELTPLPPTALADELTPLPPTALADELTPLPAAVELEIAAPPSALEADAEPPSLSFDETSPLPPSVSDGLHEDPPAVAAGNEAVQVGLNGHDDARDLPQEDPPSSAPDSESAPALAAAPSVDPQRIQRCIAWASQLRGMNGPKAHGSVEKAFITAYLPLCREIAAGVAPPEAAATADRWAEGFAQSYASAFRQLASRNSRRPRMVKDVVDISLRWLGQHYARQCQLLLVSAMRFDLGQRLNEELERRLTSRAVCADQCLLWTALPSNADAQQLAGMEAPGSRWGRNEHVPNGEGTAGIVPFSVGNRELFRLDLIATELTKAGELEAVRLGRLAVALADIIEPWILEQPPETLIVMFGDHGFHWRSNSRGTSVGQRGGALPEQVLVPASAWLLRAQRQKARAAPGIH